MTRPFHIASLDDNGWAGTALTVGEAMRSDITVCQANQTLDEIWRMMARRRSRVAVVLDSSTSTSASWAAISDLDLLAAASVRDLHDQVAAGSAAKPVVCTVPSETLAGAARLMMEHDVTELIVLDRSTNRPIGTLSSLDIVVALAPHHELARRLNDR